MQLILYFSIIFIHSVFRVLAQGPGFDWTLETDALAECQTLSVQVSSRTSEGSAVGVPPYYFLAFEVDGVPTTTPMDGIPSNMSWQVRHKRGSLLLLTMVDSNGSMGGISSVTYSVAASNDTSCLPEASSNHSVLLSNVTDTLSTCQPWGLAVHDGQKPYTLVLSSVGASLTTNATLYLEGDVYTYINRASPDGLIMASVVDATGRWGISTGLMHTQGSSDTSCQGLISTSSSSNATFFSSSTLLASTSFRTTSSLAANNEHPQAGPTNETKPVTKIASKNGLLIALHLGIGIPVLIAICIAARLCYNRRSSRRAYRHDDHMYAPRPWILPPQRPSNPANRAQFPSTAKSRLRARNEREPEDPGRLPRGSSSVAQTYSASGPDNTSMPMPAVSPQNGRQPRPEAARSRAQRMRRQPENTLQPTQTQALRSLAHASANALGETHAQQSGSSSNNSDVPPPYDSILENQRVIVIDGRP